MTTNGPVLVWIRRDLRLSDHAALSAAVATGRPVIPVFIRDASVEALGAAPRWRLEQGLRCFAQTLAALGSALILRSGPADVVLGELVAQTGASAVFWHRSYDPHRTTPDSELKTGLCATGIEARSFPGQLLFEPWAVETGQGRDYRVYTPFWRAVQGREVAPLRAAPTRLLPPEQWPGSEALEDWALAGDMGRGGAVVARYEPVGEAAALDRLSQFQQQALDRYKAERDVPGVAGCSGLSAHLSLGEISPLRLWHAGQAALAQGSPGAETFLKELVWREFAWHLWWHKPSLPERNWRSEWDSFAWISEPGADFERWCRGQTGVSIVDAAMRELYVTGRMHNRARMITASYLTKHMRHDWRLGLHWFEDCLVDWDPASNAMGWQWVAGCGPDAAPYFRVFNPMTQADKFDADQAYRRRWLAEGQGAPGAEALAWFEAIPKAWGQAPDQPYPQPVVALDVGRQRALAAYADWKEARQTLPQN